MIRKIIIVVLTLAAVVICAVWILAIFRPWCDGCSYRATSSGTAFVSSVISAENRYLFDLRVAEHARLGLGIERAGVVVAYSKAAEPGATTATRGVWQGGFRFWRGPVSNPATCGEAMRMSIPPGTAYRPSQSLVLGLRMPCWAAFVLLAAYPTIAFIRGPLRRWRRRRRGLCLKCGYDLRGNESGVCPECGEAL